MHIGDFKLQSAVKIDSQPKVAVLMPMYNDSEYLEEAIKSILSQTYQNIILVIINDGSSDP